MDFYCAPEVQAGLTDRVYFCDDDDYSVKLNGTFTYGVTPCKDFDEKKRQLEKLKKKAEEEEKKRVASLPLSQRILEWCKINKKVKHELEYAPRTLN